jgi:hypothetical protein
MKQPAAIPARLLPAPQRSAKSPLRALRLLNTLPRLSRWYVQSERRGCRSISNAEVRASSLKSLFYSKGEYSERWQRILNSWRLEDTVSMFCPLRLSFLATRLLAALTTSSQRYPA